MYCNQSIFKHACLSLHISHTHAHMYTFTHVHMYTCTTHVHTYTCTHLHMHTPTHVMHTTTAARSEVVLYNRQRTRHSSHGRKWWAGWPSLGVMMLYCLVFLKGKSDPYCSLGILPKKHLDTQVMKNGSLEDWKEKLLGQVKKTSVKMATLEPEWNETLEL